MGFRPAYYPEYEYEIKQIKLDGKPYDAIFPKEHTLVKGLIYTCWNGNAGDEYANRPDWHVTAFVWWKHDKDGWRVLEDSHHQPLKPGLGYFPLLWQLEEKSYREQIECEKDIEYHKQEIKELHRQLREIIKKRNSNIREAKL